MAPGNPPSGDAPRRRSIRPPAGAGQPGATPPTGPGARAWQPTGAAQPQAQRSGPAQPARRAAATGSSSGARRAGAAGTASAAGSRRRLIDYPRADKTGIRRWLPSWRLVLGIGMFGLALVVGAFVWFYATTDVPPPDEIAQAQRTTVYFADGVTEMGSFAEAERVIIPGDQIPEHVKQAVVAAEDRSFYDNPGINPVGIVRALWNNLRGGEQQGGSSITQQYAERYYFGRTVSSYSGKLREAILAIKLDRQQDKDEILENYLNTIYFGRDSYGIQTAAEAYFGVPASELTVEQAAVLAGIIPSPNNWDPRVDPERAQQRFDYVLGGMVETGALSQAEADALTMPETVEQVHSDRLAGPNGYLLDMVRREIVANAPITESELSTVGYKIVTTIDQRLQQAAVDAVARMPEDKPENLRTALVTLVPETGEIAALYGGPDFLTVSVNGVTQSRMQAGSTFKPLTLVGYLEEGNSLRSVYSGASPMQPPGWDTPLRNYGNQSFGQIDIVAATADSVNTVYAQMNAEIGPEKTVDVALRTGMSEDTPDLVPVPSNVLGVAAPHPMEMAHAFNLFAGQGVGADPHIVRTVEYLQDGGVVYQGGDEPERVFAADIMADTTFALTQVVEEGSGFRPRELGRPIAGKTGTSSENRSAWFIGYTPQLTTAVALWQPGPDNEAQTITPFGGYSEITGSSAPAALWTDYMGVALEGMEIAEFPPRADVGEPNEVEVPNVVGMTEAEAVAVLEEAGFTVEGQAAPSNDVEAGRVISQSATGIVRSGTPVTIVVSTGPDLVAVPNVVGRTQADAVATLQGAGLTAAVTEQESAQPEGTVLSQNPAGGEAPRGSAVTIVVSTGPPEEPEPDPLPDPLPPPPDEEPPATPPGDGTDEGGGGDQGG